MQSTTLNPTQLHLLQMFSYDSDEERLKELKEVWLNHVRNKLDEEVEKVWKEKNMSNEMMHELLNTHLRTPYNK
ncbi:MAG: hypothetical protein LBR10_00640 [Prevotellaceae bacterium]|jgi:hypothetical protein|nr:hypothetical protein [Prevotellaceae bacterium]